MSDSLVSVTVVGGVVPADLFEQVLSGRDLSGMASADYHLAPGESLRQAANRSWSYLTGVWASYKAAVETLPPGDRGTTLTRERWLLLLLRELGFGRVPTTPAGGLAADGRSFPISHIWEDVPMHLLGWGVDLDHKTPGVAGAAGASPQSLVQELLNRSSDYLWAMLSNGRVLRLLRDSTSLVGSSYVEFDLDAIFDGELFADFLVLFGIGHQSRFEQLEGASPRECWLERWRVSSVESGVRALNLIRAGVVTAIETLGTGLLQHPANVRLRDDLREGRLTVEDFRQLLLRGVYRFLFLFVAEDRGLLLDPAATTEARQRFTDFFATRRLRRLARRRSGSTHADLWRAVCVVMDGLGSEGGRPELGLAGMGGLFEPFGPGDSDGAPTDLLSSLELGNHALLFAVRSLSIVPGKGTRPDWPVDYRNLGAEELGSIYESLLEFVPRHDPASATFSLEQLSGNERKTSGSYYTPTSLVDVLLDSALDPVLDEAQQADDPRAALFAVTVCDPACGSGHFLVAAARRIAKRIAAIDTGDPEPGPEATRSILREVVGRCIYGVDVNPMAAELAKISLWLETVEAGKPLTFLDAHVKIGNSLLGATPQLIAGGIPDGAFKPIEGDDKKVASALVKRNKLERDQADRATNELDLVLAQSAHELRRLHEALASHPPLGHSLADEHVAARRYSEFQVTPQLCRARELADAWTATFVWRKTPGAPPPVTERVFSALVRDPAMVSTVIRAEIGRLAAVHRFFHWYLEFPEIFVAPASGGQDIGTGSIGGFSCVLGNPPWEHTELKEQEFFAARDPEIASAAGANRKQLIADLPQSNPALGVAYLDAKRAADCISHFSRSSGRYPLCGRGRINTYALFAEAARAFVAPRGRLGIILPTGIATDATTQYFFRSLVESGALRALYDFENHKPLFEGVDSRFKFVLLSIAGSQVWEDAAEFAFFVRDPAELTRPDVRFALKPDEITLLNPNTGTSPIFRSRHDAEITLGIYRRVPILLREGDPEGNPWGLSFMQGLFNMTSDSHLFRTRAQLEADGWRLTGNAFTRGKEQFLPLYEAKMIHHFDHRWATYGPDGVRDLTSMEKTNPHSVALPRYWVSAADVDSRLEGRSERGWLLGWRDICRSTDERTAINSVFPRAAVNHKLPLILLQSRAEVILASLTSLISDYVVRQKIGGTSLTYFYLKQLALPDPSIYEQAAPWNPTSRLDDWIVDRVDELVYTAWDLQPFALDIGDDGPPFVWDDERRALLRAELDAAYFHLYGLERDEVEHVLGTFPILRRKDEAKYGEYRTGRLVLEIYDAMAAAMSTGIPYQTILDPPPGEGLRHAEAHQAVA